MAKDLEEIMLDEGTIAELADMWFEANPEAFDEAEVDLEEGWTGEPPEGLDTVAADAARDIADQLRNPDDGSAGIVVANPVQDLEDGLYFRFAELTAAEPEEYEAWLESLDDEGDLEGDVDEPLDSDEAEDEVEGDEAVDDGEE